MSDHVEFEMSTGEMRELSDYMWGLSHFAAFHRKGVFVYHTSPYGMPCIKPATLEVFHKQGYKFVTCFPAKSKSYLGFGNFFFEEHTHITTNRVFGMKWLLFPAIDTGDYWSNPL